MKWLLTIGAIALLLLLLRRSRARDQPRATAPARPSGMGRRLQEQKAREGATCIYEEGLTILKTRLIQVEESASGLVFTLQVLRAEGLTVVPEERLHLEAAWTHMDSSAKLFHAIAAHWRLYFDPDLVQRVQELGQSGTDIKSIKRALLEHQMNSGPATPR
jgi:hypothetical protein